MSKQTMPGVGEQAPDFSGKTQANDLVQLSDYQGKKVVLYFYPKDDTPGCTKQACNLRDNWSTLQNEGFVVLGVSPDSTDSHQGFADKYQLPFPLIADPEHTIMNAYGVWGKRSLYGRKFMGVKRTTFLIDETGTIRHVFKRPNVSEHTEEILQKRAALAD